MTKSHLVILNVFSISSVWSSIYACIISWVTVPTLLQKYPGLHKCWPQYLFFKELNSSCNIFELLPFKYCTIFEGAIDGGQLTSKCTWFPVIFPRIIVIPRAVHPWINNILNLCAIFPINTLYLYFVVQTIWYCMSYCVWLPFLILIPCPLANYYTTGQSICLPVLKEITCWSTWPGTRGLT